MFGRNVFRSSSAGSCGSVVSSSSKDGPHDVAIDEGNSSIVDDLYAFVPFSGDENAISGFRTLEGPADGFAPVGFDNGGVVHATIAGHDLTNDLFGIFGSRIVAGDDRQVGRTGGPPDQRPLAAVAVAAGSHRADHAASSQPLERSDTATQGVFRVCVVDEHVERLAAFDPLEPSRHEPQGLDAGFDLVERDIEAFHRRGGRQAFGNIVSADERRGDFD